MWDPRPVAAWLERGRGQGCAMLGLSHRLNSRSSTLRKTENSGNPSALTQYRPASRARRHRVGMQARLVRQGLSIPMDIPGASPGRTAQANNSRTPRLEGAHKQCSLTTPVANRHVPAWQHTPQDTAPDWDNTVGTMLTRGGYLMDAVLSVPLAFLPPKMHRSPFPPNSTMLWYALLPGDASACPGTNCSHASEPARNTAAGQEKEGKRESWGQR